jgi:dipeptidyl aminopeptidase/acylaminoacyl peptidase
MFARRLYLILAVLAIAGAGWQMPSIAAELTPEMVVDLQLVREAKISPDGELVAYILEVPRAEDEEPGPSHQELWVVPSHGGTPTRYVGSPGSCSSPVWSPDGAGIAFVSSRGNEEKIAQLWVIRLDMGEAERITDLKTSASKPRWSPDGQSIAFIASEPKTEEEEAREEAGEDWEVVDQDYKHRRLWVVDLETREVRKITDSEHSIWNYSWSPDGSQFAVTASRTPRTDDFYMFQKLYTIPSSGGELRKVCESGGKIGTPRWSPDGEQIAVLGAVDISDPRAGSIFLVTVASGERINLTPDFPGTVEWADWADRKNLAFVATEDTRSTLNLLRVNNRKVLLVNTSWVSFHRASLAENGKSYALVGSAPYHPQEVFAGEVKGEIGPLTSHNPSLSHVQLGEQKTIHWTASDGWTVGGLLLLPVGFEEGKRYPLVVQIHGGPESAYLDGWNTRYIRWSQLLAARGYLVFMPNYRGSTGRGIEFLKGDHRDLAGREFQDVLDGIDHLVEQGLADPNRVGIGGGSYGGYFSAWAASAHSDRFRAAVVFAGITNWLSFMGTTDIPAENALVHWDLWCYDSPEICWERSPLAHVNQAHTPTLIAHGAKDLRVPLSQGWELYQAFRVRGVPTEFVIYPREPHGLRERAHKIDFMNRVLDWYDTHLKS